MPPDIDLKKRVGRKLTKKRREGHQVTMEIPERFQDGDDAEDDCTAMPGTNPYMNQSVFGMIAAAGSQVDFNARFEAQSSDEDEDDETQEGSSHEPVGGLRVAKTRKHNGGSKPEKHRRKFSESKLLQSFAKLGSKPKSKSKPKKRDDLSDSDSGNDAPPPAIQVSQSGTREQPVMSRMLEAKAELALRPSFDLPRNSKEAIRTSDSSEQPSSLAQRLMEIFNFESAEDVIEGWLCLLTLKLRLIK